MSEFNKLSFDRIKGLFFSDSHEVDEINANDVVAHFNDQIASKLPYNFLEIELQFKDFKTALLAQDKFLYHHYHLMLDSRKNLTFLIRKTNNQKYNNLYDSRDEYFEIIPQKNNTNGTVEVAKIDKVTFSDGDDFLTKFKDFEKNFEKDLIALGYQSTKCVIHTKYSINNILADYNNTEIVKFQFALIKECIVESDDPLCLINEYYPNRITFIIKFSDSNGKTVSIDIGHLQP